MTVLDGLRAAIAGLPCALSAVAPTLPGARNGGDILIRLQFDSEHQWGRHRDVLDVALTDPSIDHVVGAEYTPLGADSDWSGRRESASGPGVYRTLLVAVDPAAGRDEVGRFERGLLQLPVHVPQIRAWRLSRVDEAVGPSRWTHVWEQEYDELDGLLGAYMNHPVHWAHVDQWFDPESPLQIVRDRVVHTFCEINAPVLVMR